ncbi:hypothetical protein Egran_05400 [Elaphomyces granulatus]|uniref:C2H2-type domain-containing protein n=1 Tax=Elaphomyces granulatus TaxID=519963 RepID=A0A232LRS2_9EURO|nr:hypothetical protein Egran_05400 [Elaphomyces granulatus]
MKEPTCELDNRERPFSCRFCERSYGRKDLLVRHEKTLHAEAWAKAQESIQVYTTVPKRPVRRRQTRNSEMKNDPQQSPAQVMEGPQEIRINDDSGIPVTSYLPSPPAPSMSDGCDQESTQNTPISFGFNYPLLPAFSTAMHIIPEATALQDHQRMTSCPSNVSTTIGQFDQCPIIYDPHVHNHASDSISHHSSIPLDPNLSRVVPGAKKLPHQCQATCSESLGFGSLPSADLHQAAFPSYLAGQTSHTAYWTEFSTSEHAAAPSLSATEDRMPSVNDTLSARPPRLIKECRCDHHLITVDQAARAALLSDLRKRLPLCNVEMEIPNSQRLQNFIRQFFNGFHSHLPIFHVPTFDAAKTPSPLVLAMCSIGALYHLERKTASCLRQLANDALHQTHISRLDHNPTEARALWEVQCKLLTMSCAAFGGDSAAVASALEDTGIFHREYTLRRAALSASSGAPESTDWETWIHRESSKRLLYGIFIVSSLLTIVYSIPPCLSTTDDLQIELPTEERLWAAADEKCWREAIASSGAVTRLNANQALTQLIFGKEYNLGTESRWPAFATTIMMYAVNLHIWHITQCTQSFINFSVDPKMEEQMKALSTAQTEAALARCHKVLDGDRSAEWHTYDEFESPLIFNSLALLRNCYVRAFAGNGTFNGAVLFSDNDEDITLAARNCVQLQLFRTAFLTKAVDQVLDAMVVPIRAGALLTRKTAAFTWSIEHAISGWDSTIFLTKWIHTLEMQRHYAPPDPAEKRNLDNLKELLLEIDQDESGCGSLAARVSRAWATFLDDVWVWEITWRMGKVLRRLADVYEEEQKSQQIFP